MANTVVKDSKIQELIELDKKHYIHPTTDPKLLAEQGPPIIFAGGEGIYADHVNGDRYIDGMSMLWNVNLGHGVAELADAAREQMMKIAYASSFKGFSNEPAIELAKKIADMTPGDLEAVFYTSGGSESNDTAFKLARFYWEIKGKPSKKKVIAVTNAYHGVTIGAQTATALQAFHEFSGSNIPGLFVHATAHLVNAEQGNKNDPQYEKSIRAAIEREGADNIAAIIIEPVQGAGGVNIPPEGYLQAVRKLADENDILFIADEVICGFGRTGTMFGIENWNVVPDLMSIAKGITSGYSQLGAVVMNKEFRDTIVSHEGVLAHGFTYSGHPTACAVALKNIEIMERDNVVANVKEMEKVMKEGLAYLKEKHDIVTNTRAIGLLAALDIQEDRDNNKYFADSVKAAPIITDECFERKLILRPLGMHSIAIAPPLIINKEEVEKIISILDESITVFKNKLK